MNVKTNFKKHLSLCFTHNKKSSCFNHEVMEANGQKTAFDIKNFGKSKIAKPLTRRGGRNWNMSSLSLQSRRRTEDFPWRLTSKTQHERQDELQEASIALLYAQQENPRACFKHGAYLGTMPQQWRRGEINEINETNNCLTTTSSSIKKWWCKSARGFRKREIASSNLIRNNRKQPMKLVENDYLLRYVQKKNSKKEKEKNSPKYQKSSRHVSKNNAMASE